jgi:hypothetical protein
MNQGMKTGPNTHRLMEQIFLQCKHPEQGFKTCQGVVQLALKHGKEKTEEAALICLQYDYISYRKLDRILKVYHDDFLSGIEKEPLPVIIDHENVRGHSYYQ